MLTATEIAGFVGAGLAGAAYVPQISHLIKARCSAGISQLAFAVWLLASMLTTTRAIAIHAGVFIVLGGTQIVATALIVLYAARYKDTPCPSHLPRPPRAKTPLGQATRLTNLVPDVRRTWPRNSKSTPCTTGRSWRTSPPSAARTLQFIPSAVHRIQARHPRETR
jgi:uncharacterized protein with PQ loop repeat